jgi:hypothetical protein
MKNRLLATTVLLLAACTAPGPDLDDDLAALLRQLPGSYAGEIPNPRSPTGEMLPVFHKLAPIDAPQFGDQVLYYQLSTGSADGPALQQKIFVFDATPGRAENRMRAYVFAPGQAAGNLEQDPDRWAALDPAALMDFPPECAFRWTRVGGGFEAVVNAGDCAFKGRSFPQTIRPQMTYRLVGDEFVWDEVLYGDGRKVLASTEGPRAAYRE